MAVEEPKFTLVTKDGAFELRDYAPVVVAEVAAAGDRNRATNDGFRRLAGYIFGGNHARTSIAMTAPVTQLPAGSQSIAMTAPVGIAGEGGNWVIQFTMPSAFTMETLPEPDDHGVHLRSIPATRMAVLKFSGFSRDHEVSARIADLMEQVRRRGLVPAGAASLARYDPPWTPWFMRRNEVMVPVALPAANAA